ncbi:MAG: homoserine O-acetyltransferase/O-succinyltransferase family protein, partial [Pirellulales bacterium]
MPVFLNPKYRGLERRSVLNWPRVQSNALQKPRSEVLHIGLINNMADAAMAATEYQFLTLLEAAAGEMLVQITFYAFPEVARKPHGQRRLDSIYFGIEQLWQQPPEEYPDGLIFTGREPRTPDLREEVFWPSFLRVLKWTQEHARSAVCSCLAAHAAVLALDGIGRVRNQHKHFGIFTCEQAAPHALLAGAPASLRVPHSRWNGVSADQLAAKGYQVLTRTSDSGVDTFIKQEA